MKEFSYNLKRLRESKNVSKSEVARFLNMAPSGYSVYENGKIEIGDREPTLKNLIKLADFFNVSVDELLNHHVDEFERCKSLWESAGFEIETTLIPKEEEYKLIPSSDGVVTDENGNFILLRVRGTFLGENNPFFYDVKEFINYTNEIENEIERQNSETFKSVANLIFKKRIKEKFLDKIVWEDKNE